MSPWIVLILSLAFGVATWFWFPKQAVKRKGANFFWGFMVAIFSVVLGLPIERSFKTHEQVQDIGQTLSHLEQTLSRQDVKVLTLKHRQDVYEYAVKRMKEAKESVDDLDLGRS